MTHGTLPTELPSQLVDDLSVHNDILVPVPPNLEFTEVVRSTKIIA